MAFEFHIVNTRKHRYPASLWVILVLNITGLSFVAYNTLVQKEWLICLITVAAVITLLLLEKRLKKILAFDIRLAASLMLVASYLLLGYYIPAVGMFLIFVLYLKAIRPLKVVFTKENILYPSFPIRIIHWNEISNVVLKDRMLTIDFRNNKLIQQLIEESNSVNEPEFNDFCSQQIKKK